MNKNQKMERNPKVTKNSKVGKNQKVERNLSFNPVPELSSPGSPVRRSPNLSRHEIFAGRVCGCAFYGVQTNHVSAAISREKVREILGTTSEWPTLYMRDGSDVVLIVEGVQGKGF